MDGYDSVLEPIFELKEVEKMEDGIHRLLCEALEEQNKNGSVSDKQARVILNYLASHKKLLKEAVYPHLCTELEKMAR